MTHQNLKPHLHALKNRHGTPNFWHRADDFKAQHSQFSTCKRVGPKCNVAPVSKILGVPRLPPRGSLGTGKRGTVPKNSFVKKLTGAVPGLFPFSSPEPAILLACGRNRELWEQPFRACAIDED